MKYDIKYRLRVFELLEEDGGESRRFWKGYLTQLKTLVKNKDEAYVLNRRQLEDSYSKEEIYMLEHKTHPSIDLEQECKELDDIFTKIKAIKKENFKVGVKTHITFEGLEGEVITYQNEKENELLLPSKDENGEWNMLDGVGVMTHQKSKQLDFVLEWKGHKAYWGGVKPDMAKLNLTDKIRKEYNYDDPFKHD